jgi:hypothetical protein
MRRRPAKSGETQPQKQARQLGQPSALDLGLACLSGLFDLRVDRLSFDVAFLISVVVGCVDLVELFVPGRGFCPVLDVFPFP